MPKHISPKVKQRVKKRKKRKKGKRGNTKR